MVSLRLARTAAEAEEWALVLAAAGIVHRVEPHHAGWTLLVPEADARRAHAALDAYLDETRGEPDAPVSEAAPRHFGWVCGVVVAVVVLALFAVTGPPARSPRAFERGAASAGRLLSGEPWRAVTALTLHVDVVHAASNAVAIALLLPALAQQLGVGVGLWLVLLAGAGGNVVAAMAQNPSHGAVGASTAIFGAIGALAALRLLRAPRQARTRPTRWMIAATAVLLVAMLGTSRDADVLAHACGLVCGGALGLVAGAALRRPLPHSIQWVLVALGTLAVAACWRLALA